MSEPAKTGDKGGNGLSDMPASDMIVVLQRMLGSLEAQIRPLQEEIQVVKQLLRSLEDTQFLDERRQKLAELRQIRPSA